ncbi:conserved hypothetical protein [Uncinocarpus reesii 1704]|uniref:HPt domain-containing protein n=1 Tax=Uncinocarpus reesii (strain UAMH 1704) TaxID=336963 RepID=C4JRR3_UNCRE|nr:uncharacterized protein UREG_05152 [Uncinocarpus reesii 1704]EEP80310.1 conserved hypothetical protein [Uncinocarpus reesii 1704]
MAPSATPAAAKSTDDLGLDLTGKEDLLDRTTFEQILEMDDDDEDREFSKGLVHGFFEQAESTFDKMEDAIAARDLHEISQLGHFLKGSSATLGLTKVKDACEKIQHFGAQKDESGTVDEPDETKSLANIKKTLTEVKDAYKEVAKVLSSFYQDTESS